MNWAGWLNQEYLVLGIIIALFLFVLLLIKEWIRHEKNNLIWRVLASFIVISTLLCLFLKPAFFHSPQEQVGIILTDGYQTDQFDSLKSLLPEAGLLNYTDSIFGYSKLESFDSIVILGAGIPTYDLWQWKNLRATFIPSILKEGIVDVVYDEESIASEMVEFKLNYKGIGQYRKVILGGLGGTLDSTEIRHIGNQTVYLSTKTLVAEGQYLLNVSVQDSLSNILEQDTLPITILPAPSLKILIINQFPTFDTKYLKSFLAESGHQVVVRNKVSKKTFRYEYYNTKRTTRILTESSLKETDLMIIDKGSYDLLLNRENEIVDKAISEFGLGVFLQPSEGLFKDSEMLKFKMKSNKEAECKIEMKGKTIKLPKYEFNILPSYRYQTVIDDSNDNIVSAYERKGLGRIGTTLFYNSYQLLFEGETDIYASLWTKIINAVCRKKNAPLQIQINPSEISSINEPLKIEVTAGQDFQISLDGAPISMIQSTDLNDQWSGEYWPKTTGWHNLIVNDSLKAKSFYVFASSSWQNRRYTKRILANQRFFNYSPKNTRPAIQVKKSVNPFWFLLLFVLSAGYLWLEPKW